MKHNNLFLWLLGLTVCWLASCSEEDGRVTYPYSCPEISELQFSTTDQTPAADSLYFSVKIHDPQTPLSTLEVMQKHKDKDGRLLFAGLQAFRQLWPIPQGEKDKNTNLTQNEGY